MCCEIGFGNFEFGLLKGEVSRHDELVVSGKDSHHVREDGIRFLKPEAARRAAGRTITYVWRNPGFSRQSQARSLKESTHASPVLYRVVSELFREVVAHEAGSSRVAGRGGRKFHLIGVRLSNFVAESQQLSPFQNQRASSGLDRAFDAVRDRFGADAWPTLRDQVADGDHGSGGPGGG